MVAQLSTVELKSATASLRPRVVVDPGRSEPAVVVLGMDEEVEIAAGVGARGDEVIPTAGERADEPDLGHLREGRGRVASQLSQPIDVVTDHSEVVNGIAHAQDDVA